MNMNDVVIIPTVGLGSRMGNYTKNINKSLLPYMGKPIISHIIERFPNNSTFIIPVGHLAQQVKDFCKLTYPDRKIIFVSVDDWVSDKSGTAYTLRECEKYINEPFWYVPCDTYFTEDLTQDSLTENTYYVKNVPQNITSLYTMIDIGEYSKIKNILFKKSTPNDWYAFTGVMYIKDYKNFFTDLKNLKSNEFIHAIKKNENTKILESWIDFGNPEIYQTAVSKSQKFDFSKQNEITYICNQKVIKWYLDDIITEKKYKRVTFNPDVFPSNCTISGHYISYDFVVGKTLYENYNIEIFKKLLDFLESKLWIRKDLDITEECRNFYKTKTLIRVNQFLENFNCKQPVNFVDGVKVNDYKYYLDKINWHLLINDTQSAFIHGDLQFDNIVYGNDTFTIIDWRHEFAGLLEVGDLYYDLAKLAGGLIINYLSIKNHNFNIEIVDNSVTLSIPNIEDLESYMIYLENWVKNKGLNWYKVQLLIPIIFWNMAPLHTAPFNHFLWYLGIKLFAELE